MESPCEPEPFSPSRPPRRWPSRFGYRTISATSVWVDNPKLCDYNRWREKGRVNGYRQGEDLSYYRDLGLYRQGAVISYNYDKPIRYGKGSGSGIFLHYAKRYTGGCVGLDSMTELTNTVRRLDPAKNPRIIIKAWAPGNGG